MNEITFLIFQLAVLIFSVMIHEISHGYVADKLGDPTARLAGRLTLNPKSHIDPFGSIILPLVLAIPALFGQSTFIIGWAKPVPYNPNNLKKPVRDSALIAAAGPMANILIAAVFGILIRIIVATGNVQAGGVVPLIVFFSVIVSLNILLAIFNLVPLPPLDGSKVLFSLLPRGETSFQIITFLERYGLFLLLFFIFFGFQFIVPIVDLLYSVLVGPILPFQ
ncbi:MAG: site-2 protease family protein [Candidatus Liptonbacteria bacterium]|nr:site-2 protease family protein [Candidatus Liptonbacteria bacterium]